MIEPEIKELVVALPLDLTIPSAEPEPDTAEPALQEQDDLCHGKVGENVWYCAECEQYFDHRVTGPHPKPARRDEEEHELVLPTINHATRRALLQQQRRKQPPVQQQLGMCQHCVKPFLGKNRCQCSVKKAKLVMVNAPNKPAGGQPHDR